MEGCLYITAQAYVDIISLLLYYVNNRVLVRQGQLHHIFVNIDMHKYHCTFKVCESSENIFAAV